MDSDEAPLADADEADLAEVVAGAWEAKGYRTTTKERGSNLLVFAKRRADDGSVRGAVVWVAARRSVGESSLRQLRSLAENVGASDAVCVTVGGGGVTDSGAARELGIDHLDGDDLRDDPDVDIPDADGADGADESGGLTDFDTGPDTGVGSTGDVWDGQTTAPAAVAAPFDGVWNDVTDGGSVDEFADLAVWDGTTRFAEGDSS